MGNSERSLVVSSAAASKARPRDCHSSTSALALLLVGVIADRGNHAAAHQALLQRSAMAEQAMSQTAGRLRAQRQNECAHLAEQCNRARAEVLEWQSLARALEAAAEDTTRLRSEFSMRGWP